MNWYLAYNMMEGKNRYCSKMTFYIVTEGKKGEKAQPSGLWFHFMIKTGGDVFDK